MKEYKNCINTFFLKTVKLRTAFIYSLRNNPICLQHLNKIGAFVLLHLFFSVLLINNIQPAFSADERKPLSESETKNYLEQLENLDSFSIKTEGYKKFDAFFYNLAKKAQTHIIPDKIIYKLEELATFRVDNKLLSQVDIALSNLRSMGVSEETIERSRDNYMDPKNSSYNEHERGQVIDALGNIAFYQALPSDVVTRMSKMLHNINNPNIWTHVPVFFIGVAYSKPNDKIPKKTIQILEGYLKYNLQFIEDTEFFEDSQWLRKTKRLYLFALRVLLAVASRQPEDISLETLSLLKDISSVTKGEYSRIANQILNKKRGCKVAFQ